MVYSQTKSEQYLYRHDFPSLDHSWNNALINFNHHSWFPAPNYVVMKLWREHYAPDRLAVIGEKKSLNAVATKSEDGNTIFFKAINSESKIIDTELTITGGFSFRKVSMQLIAPGSLDSENTFDRPDAVHPMSRKIKRHGKRIVFALPPLSAAVVTIKRLEGKR